MGSTARPYNKQQPGQRMEVVRMSSSGTARPSQATLPRGLQALHPVSEANVANPEAADLQPEDLAVLESSDPSHILNATCKNCAKKEILCIKRYKKKACKPCADRKTGCPMSREILLYWNRVRPPHERSRSRSRTPIAASRRQPSRGATPSQPSGAPSFAVDILDTVAVDKIKRLEEKVLKLAERLETVSKSWVDAEKKAEERAREVAALRQQIQEKWEAAPEARDIHEVPPFSGLSTQLHDALSCGLRLTEPRPWKRPLSPVPDPVPPMIGESPQATVGIPPTSATTTMLAPLVGYVTSPSVSQSSTDQSANELETPYNHAFAVGQIWNTEGNPS